MVQSSLRKLLIPTKCNYSNLKDIIQSPLYAKRAQSENSLTPLSHNSIHLCLTTLIHSFILQPLSIFLPRPKVIYSLFKSIYPLLPPFSYIRINVSAKVFITYLTSLLHNTLPTSSPIYVIARFLFLYSYYLIELKFIPFWIYHIPLC